MGLTTITGNADFDGIGTILIGVLLVIIAIVLAREMKSLLIGEAASDADIDAMTKAIDAAPYVERLLNLRSEHIGPDELLVAAKIEFSHELTVPQLADAIDEVEVRVASGRAHRPPAVHRTGHPPGRPSGRGATERPETARRVTLEWWQTTTGSAITSSHSVSSSERSASRPSCRCVSWPSGPRSRTRT